ncbi:Hypp6816 [Branchiostoma lanceolatum]|uniref:Hypp6816 protein n=1 Tax=Branchiostoma lanceolatum TaxID=7740 RepID=A0A8J9YVR6_BRALA|nr:Hypp6816 [Branchiostoma lanceolatum]
MNSTLGQEPRFTLEQLDLLLQVRTNVQLLELTGLFPTAYNTLLQPSFNISTPAPTSDTANTTRNNSHTISKPDTPPPDNTYTGYGKVTIDINEEGPLTAEQEDTFTALYRRKAETSTDKGSVLVKTGGQPLKLVHVPKPRKKASEAAPSTIRKHAKFMQGVRDQVSRGDPAALMKEELKIHSRHELQKMLQELKLDQVRIPTGHLLAAKVDIGMNWNQCRKLRRWLKGYGVSMESEKASRAVATQLLSKIPTIAEKLPFSVKGAKDSTVELLPCAYVVSLQDAIFDNLKRNQTAGTLTWHAGKIPEKEIWVKVGGDHGGGSFKMAFQILNKERPNSKSNTTVFCIFNAKDSRENLNQQVVVPGLHISLGIYLKLFKLMESELHDIDLKLQTYLSTVLDEGEVTKEELLADEHLGKFKAYVAAIDEARGLDEKADALEEKLEQEENQLGWQAFTDLVEPSADTDMADAEFEKACSAIKDLCVEKDKLRKGAAELRQKASVKVGQGPITSELDPALQELHVQRQAYHSGSFIGNHDESIKKLTAVITSVVTDIMEKYDDLPLTLVPKARETAQKYRQLFELFASCHKKYSHAGQMDDSAIDELGTAITAFMTYYREKVPNGSVPIKMHMLEHHVVPCVRKWRFGLGFLGEQGLEQVHALFNNIGRTTSGIADPVAKLNSTLKNHLIGVSPDHTGGVPDPVPRKKRKEN